MAKPIQLDDGSDSEDLQALFDSIAAGTPPAPPPARKDASGDSDDLQDLFDSVVEAQAASSPSMAGPVDAVADGSPQE